MSAPDLSTLTVTIEDITKGGWCALGARRWWRAQAYAMSFGEFLKTGMTADLFLAGGDALAQLCVERKIAREFPEGDV